MDIGNGVKEENGGDEKSEEGAARLRHGLWQLNDLWCAGVDWMRTDWSEDVGVKGWKVEGGDEISREERTAIT